MGIDFIRRVAPNFRKAWDRRRVELCTPDLFTKPVVESSRTAIAEIVGTRLLKAGEGVIIEDSSSGLVCRVGIETVARFSDPPLHLCALTKAAAGLAKGRVEAVHELSGFAEISFS